jgi:hypothetical protein
MSILSDALAKVINDHLSERKLLRHIRGEGGGGPRMYRKCRHIKPNGLRCESPALKQAHFCYFHSKIHSVGAEPNAKYGPMLLPSPEGSAGIQLAIAKITDALINNRIDPKRAGLLLYAMQIASQHLDFISPGYIDETIESMTHTADGHELAPEEIVEEDGDEEEDDDEDEESGEDDTSDDDAFGEVAN